MKVRATVFVRVIAPLVAVLLSGCMVAERPSTEETRIAVSRRIEAGIEYMHMERPGEARRHISRALELDSRSPEAHNAMALLYKYEGDHKRAEGHFRRAIRYDGNYSLARNNYGSLLMQERRYEEALHQFTEATNNPSYENRSIAFENKGKAHMALRQFDPALDAFNTALRLNSEEPEPMLEMALIYFHREQFQAADNVYRRYAERIGAQPPRGLWLGIRLAHKLSDADRLGSYELALERIYPGSPEYREWKAWIARGRI